MQLQSSQGNAPAAAKVTLEATLANHKHASRLQPPPPPAPHCTERKRRYSGTTARALLPEIEEICDGGLKQEPPGGPWSSGKYKWQTQSMVHLVDPIQNLVVGK